MQRSSTQQTFIEAPPETVWELVGDPNRHPEWWPEMIEVECTDLEEGCSYRGVVKGPFGATPHDLTVDRLRRHGRDDALRAHRGSGRHVRGGLLHDRAEQYRHEGARRRDRPALHALMAGELASEPEKRSSDSGVGIGSSVSDGGSCSATQLATMRISSISSAGMTERPGGRDRAASVRSASSDGPGS